MPTESFTVECDKKDTLEKVIYHSYEKRLNKYEKVLKSNLDFHGKKTGYGSHNFHAFAAKFPPQLPHIFIKNITKKYDIVLDPMAGSGTALVEAISLERNTIGVDIDPLAQLICNIKTKKFSKSKAKKDLSDILININFHLKPRDTKRWIKDNFNEKTKKFVDYWFEEQTQSELASLMCSIQNVISDEDMKEFFLGLFSSIIITKSGGVSKARDLAHTRPHRDENKKVKNAIQQFQKKAEKTIDMLDHNKMGKGTVRIIPGDARKVPLDNNSVDMIVTSPPYANAIDYMRAHKFSLVWFGWSIERLSNLRGEYIGNERLIKISNELPPYTTECCDKIEEVDEKKARILKRYFNDMSLCILEMYRVLNNESAAVVVIGTSTMRGIEVPTNLCLREIGEEIGFKCIHINQRKLDRNKRMMPIAHKSDKNGIENRLHYEYTIGFWKE